MKRYFLEHDYPVFCVDKIKTILKGTEGKDDGFSVVFVGGGTSASFTKSFILNNSDWFRVEDVAWEPGEDELYIVFNPFTVGSFGGYRNYCHSDHKPIFGKFAINPSKLTEEKKKWFISEVQRLVREINEGEKI
jgi:hypothetical protein